LSGRLELDERMSGRAKGAASARFSSEQRGHPVAGAARDRGGTLVRLSRCRLRVMIPP